MGERLTPTITGGLDAHQARIQGVLEISLEDAILDQHGAPRRIALVVDRQGTAPIGDGAVVNHRDALCRHALADTTRKRRAALAVEVAFQSVADGLVQQDARPAGTEHDRHGAGRRRLGSQIYRGLMDGLAGVLVQPFVGEIAVIVAAATTGVALLAATTFDHDDGNGYAHERSHVGSQVAVRARHQDHFPGTGNMCHDLDDAGIERAGELFQPFEQLHLLGIREGRNRIVRHVERRRFATGQGRHAARSPGGSNGTGRLRRARKRRQADLVGIGKSGFLAAHGPHTNALVDVVAARLDDAFLQAPGL